MNLEEYLRQHSQVGLAKALGVSQGMVGHWLHGRKRITAERAVDIERATEGLVAREDLRPDLFGEREEETDESNQAA